LEFLKAHLQAFVENLQTKRKTFDVTFPPIFIRLDYTTLSFRFSHEIFIFLLFEYYCA
jgi:hypothetical protein